MAMNYQAQNNGEELARFRDYLRFLAQVELEPRFQRKLDPSDIVQDTLLKAYQALDQYRGENDLEMAAWLRQILARNLANTTRDLQCRKRDVRRERSLDEALNQSSVRLNALVQAEEPSPSEKLQSQEILFRLSRILNGLPEAQRQALILKHWHEWSLAEIAETLGRTTAGVAGLLRRALERLREQLSDMK